LHLRQPFYKDKYSFSFARKRNGFKMYVYSDSSLPIDSLELNRKQAWFATHCRFLWFYQYKKISKELMRFIYNIMYDDSISCSIISKFINNNNVKIPIYYTCYECPNYTIRSDDDGK